MIVRKPTSFDPFADRDAREQQLTNQHSVAWANGRMPSTFDELRARANYRTSEAAAKYDAEKQASRAKYGYGTQAAKPVEPAPATQPTAPLDPAARRKTFMDRQLPGSVYSSTFNPAPGNAEGASALAARNEWLKNMGYGTPSEAETNLRDGNASTPATPTTATAAPYGTYDPSKLGIARRPVSQRGAYGVLSSDRL